LGVGISDVVEVVVEVVVLVVGVVTEFWTLVWVSTVAGDDGVVWTDVLEVVVVCVCADGLITLVGFTGDTGLTGLVTLVGLVTDFTQVFDVVTQGCHIG
jgi:hypothetical protein